MRADPGAGFFALENDCTAAISACCEAEPPEAVRACALAGARIVIVPTALGSKWDVVARRINPARACRT